MEDLKNIKKIRKKLGITQNYLAKKANISQSLIAKIESNKLDPTFTKAQKIFEVLNNLKKENELKAKDIMTKNIISVSQNDLVKEAVKKMKTYEISQLPVIDKTITGTISESAILNNLDKIDGKIEEIMEEAPPTISKETGVEAISNLLKFFPMVLVMEKGIIEGIITKADLLRNI